MAAVLILYLIFWSFVTKCFLLTACAQHKSQALVFYITQEVILRYVTANIQPSLEWRSRPQVDFTTWNFTLSMSTCYAISENRACSMHSVYKNVRVCWQLHIQLTVKVRRFIQVSRSSGV